MMNIIFHTCCEFIHVASRKDMYKTIIKLLEEIRYKQSMQPYISADFNVKGDIYAYHHNVNNNNKKSNKQKRSNDDLQLLVNIEININYSSNNATHHKYTPCYLTRDENSAINMFYLGMQYIYNNGGRPDEFQYKEKRSNMIQTNPSTSLSLLHGNRLMQYDGIDAHRTPITKKRPNTNSHPSNNNDDNDFEREINEL